MNTTTLYAIIIGLVLTNLWTLVSDRRMYKRISASLEESGRMNTEIANRYLDLLDRTRENDGCPIWLMDDSNGQPVRYSYVEPNEYFREHFTIRRVKILHENDQERT